MKLSNKQTSVFSFPIDINDNNTLTGRISKGGGGGGGGVSEGDDMGSLGRIGLGGLIIGSHTKQWFKWKGEW